jgi:hypothetical protein
LELAADRQGEPPILGHMTGDIVYERLQGVLPKLRELNPTDEKQGEAGSTSTISSFLPE